MNILLLWFIGACYDFIDTSAHTKQSKTLEERFKEEGLEEHIEQGKITYTIISIIGSIFWFIFWLRNLIENIKILIKK